MRIRTITIAVTVLTVISLFLGIHVSAVGTQADGGIMATDSFSFSVSGQSYKKDSTAKYLEAGESVTIKGSYSPFSASVSYGLLGPNGLFYGVEGKDGSIDYTFMIERSGSYYFTVLNYSSVPVSVTGYINY